MGVERIIRIPEHSSVSWPAIHSRLASVGEEPAMRMIDSELALPDEEPPADWRELRLALRGGMATLRRTSTSITCITWGNAEPALLRSWNLLAWAVAATTGGSIDTNSRTASADVFAVAEKLFPS